MMPKTPLALDTPNLLKEMKLDNIQQEEQTLGTLSAEALANRLPDL
jgi:hypothetical protein